MFPFESRWRWWTSPGYLHLVEAVEDRLDDFQEPFRAILSNRAKRMKIALNARLAVLVLLNIGIAASALVWAARFGVPGLAEARGWLDTVARSLTGFSVALTVVFLLISRYLGQLQADLLASMVLGSPGATWMSEQEQARLERLERRAEEKGWRLSGGAAPDDEDEPA